MKTFYKPTPKKWRKLGDSLLVASTTLAAFSIANEWDKWIQITALVTGVIGKFLTNFFSE